MSNNNRSRRSLEKAESTKKLSEMGRTYARAAESLTRLSTGVENPKQYLDGSVALGVLYSIPTVIDIFVGDFDRFFFSSKVNNERKLSKQIKILQTDLERLLDLVYKSEVESFSTTAKDKEEAIWWANEQCDLACTFARILKFLFCYCSETKDKWRVDQLMSKLDELVSKDAQDALLTTIQDKCMEHLARLGYADIEQAKQGVDRIKQDIETIKTAKAKGLSLTLEKE